MLRKIWNTVKAIGAFISAVVDFFKMIIESIIAFFAMIGKAISYLFGIIGFVPGFIMAFFTAIILVLIIRKIVNR